MTSLCGGKRVPKDHSRIEACGALDELCSFLGMLRSLVVDVKTKKVIESIQRELFTIGAEVTTESESLKKLARRITYAHCRRLEKLIYDIEKKRKFEGCCFYLPGEDLLSSTFDIARTVARRAERLMVTLKSKGELENPDIIVYLNRLSDLLYVMARHYEKRHKKVKRAFPF